MLDSSFIVSQPEFISRPGRHEKSMPDFCTLQGWKDNSDPWRVGQACADPRGNLRECSG